uniref:ER membrane protein complex subunit 7 beta-sandwich domain-containing protein n=1 Tax=Corethron hystrix TaxID=216773 RepID=A0A7S1BVI9_9STRA|mmetsp:Transcript_41181/g.96593  ORF Transcript_41181/g.96593 Transcript_41181/m.96593 type:complete len:267 (+) Transcript_41181:104-904(+)|eukprot:CAMPEP_0113309942 /NCGR_PEP_ID=MMETSP0010_2-20120614/7779_1 /TAXON_ID=216773 ORGANISM="Corethron hystrix, Strain 308" /NCGR_SAMPLE_ID=MMETSP0010_2 /ASSEMBLY_ACC=CAM_ASM_000155 /LENGTH=266 /DNA_ID=CAMNT_0000165285 /DNA_START=67 /DNA_END=867 /DNA_ORIENTATION=- /assembly_acc=CAM_ASM_000155
MFQNECKGRFLSSIARLMLISASFAATIAIATATSATATTTTTLTGQLLYPNRTPVILAKNSTRSGSHRIVLDDGSKYATVARPDGSFSIPSVPVPGVYIIDSHSVAFAFSQVKVQLSLNDEGKVVRKCIEYMYLGAPKFPVNCSESITITALGENQYFESVRGFSIFGMLKNPMVLLMVFSGGMMFLMPKMMENMDPEEREIMQKQMAAQGDPAKMLGNLWVDLKSDLGVGNEKNQGTKDGQLDTNDHQQQQKISTQKARAKKRR